MYFEFERTVYNVLIPILSPSYQRGKFNNVLMFYSIFNSSIYRSLINALWSFLVLLSLLNLGPPLNGRYTTDIALSTNDAISQSNEPA